MPRSSKGAQQGRRLGDSVQVIRADGGFRPPTGDGSPCTRATPEGIDLVRMLDAMPTAFCLLDPEWRFRYLNAEAERLLGRPRGECLGRRVPEVCPDTVGGVFDEAFRSAYRSGHPATFEAPRPGMTSDGCYEVRAWAEPDGLAVYVLDVTDRVRAQEAAARATGRAALLASVTAELSGALDGESALGRLAQLVVPTMADACIVTVVDREGRARDVGSWHADPRRRTLLQRYTEIRLDTLPMSSPVARALVAGTSVTESVTAETRSGEISIP